MNYYYITGTSRGIGKSLAENLLKDKNNFVTGISRTNSITHPNYRHVMLDLSKTKKTAQFEFLNHADAERIVLVNNAGHIGGIKRAGNHDYKTFADTYKVNLTAPSILINNFINSYRDFHAEKIIMNISSGAGRHPIDAASSYCASKAGLDMFSRVVAEEQKVTSGDFRIVVISVGVVDTVMQKKLRDTDGNEFSRKQEFISYKEKGQIIQPEELARKLIQIIDNIDKINDVVFSIREFDQIMNN
jgi:benzil reductase ((S)-benzoin forming)